MSLFLILKLINTVIFTGLAGLHVYWALRGLSQKYKPDLSLAVPQKQDKTAFTPGFWSTMLVALGLLAFAWISLWAIKPIYKGTSPLVASPWWCVYGNLAIALIFFLRSVGDFNYVGLFKKVKNSRFATYDTLFYSPLCLIISSIAFYIYLQIKY